MLSFFMILAVSGITMSLYYGSAGTLILNLPPPAAGLWWWTTACTPSCTATTPSRLSSTQFLSHLPWSSPPYSYFRWWGVASSTQWLIITSKTVIFLVQAECVRCPWVLQAEHNNSIFYSLSFFLSHQVTFLPEGVVLWLWNIAWAPWLQKY